MTRFFTHSSPIFRSLRERLDRRISEWTAFCPHEARRSGRHHKAVSRRTSDHSCLAGLKVTYVEINRDVPEWKSMKVPRPRIIHRSEEEADSRLYGEGHPDGLPVFEPKVGAHLRNRKKVNSPSQLLALQEMVKFKASHGRWRIAKDLVGLVRRGHGDEKDESYIDKLRRETGRGKSESSTYGLAEDRKSVV